MPSYAARGSNAPVGPGPSSRGFFAAFVSELVSEEERTVRGERKEKKRKRKIKIKEEKKEHDARV